MLEQQRDAPAGAGSDRARREGEEHARVAGGFLLTFCLLAVLLALSTIQLIPAARLPGALAGPRQAVYALWPQGWDFFAHEPDQNAVETFRVGAAGRLSAGDELQLSAVSDWGLSERQLTQFVEFDVLAQQVPARDWLNCARLAPSSCRAADLRHSTLEVSDPAEGATVCGHTLIAMASPRRWTPDTRLWMSDWKIESIANVVVECAH